MEHDEAKARAQAKRFEETLLRELPNELATEQISLSLEMKKRISEGKDPIGDEDIKNRWLSLQFNAAYMRASQIAMETAYGTDVPGYSNTQKLQEPDDEPGPLGRN